MKPDSSRKTSVAPRRLAFFLDAGRPPFASVRFPSHRVLSRAVQAFGKSIPVSQRGSCERARRENRRRSDRISIVELEGRSTGRWSTRMLSLPWRGALPTPDAGSRSKGDCVLGGASKARRRDSPRPPCANDSPTLDWLGPSFRLLFGCGPPSTKRVLVVDAVPIRLRFLSVSYAQYSKETAPIH